MKKIAVILALFVFTAQVTHAQIPVLSALPKFDLGIKAGVNYEQLNGSGVSSDYNPGFQGGIFMGLRKKRIGVQLEGLVSFSKYNLMDSLHNGEFKATYINIPLLFEYKVIPLLWLQIGPQYSGIVSVQSPNGFVGDAKNIFKSGTGSGVVGLELKLPLHINVGARYILGITDLNNNGGDAWKQRVFQIHAGLAFL
ncbi:MAG: porin family protein [Flavipsychrobacter sp.]|nr:porin family protein [Flavipsychrobacter sp.]